MQVSLNFWILWCALCVGMGAGFTMLNNLSQMVEALGGGKQAQGVYVLLFTTVNTVGRMAAGYIPEQLLHARGTPRWVLGSFSHPSGAVGLVSKRRWCQFHERAVKPSAKDCIITHMMWSDETVLRCSTGALQDNLCAHCVCNDMRGVCAVGIHQPEVAARLRRGLRLCLRLALEPDASKNPQLLVPFMYLPLSAGICTDAPGPHPGHQVLDDGEQSADRSKVENSF